MSNSLPTISPMPPVAPIAMPWDVPIVDPVAEIAAARAECGDTFVVESGDDRSVFLFSPEGVRSFYELPENEASKGYADYRLLVRKLPEELFVGRRTIMHTLFGHEDVASYLTNLDRAIDVQFEELGERGEFEAFAFTPPARTSARVDLLGWSTPPEVPCSTNWSSRSMRSTGRPRSSIRATWRPLRRKANTPSVPRSPTSKHSSIDVIRAHDEGPAGENELFSRIVDAWDDTAEPDRSIGVARDVIVAHLVVREPLRRVGLDDRGRRRAS